MSDEWSFFAPKQPLSFIVNVLATTTKWKISYIVYVLLVHIKGFCVFRYVLITIYVTLYYLNSNNSLRV